jgi:hypothetical protein
MILTPSAERLLPIPSSNEVRLARGQEVRLGQKKVYSRWSALSRVDVYRVEPEERSMFMPGRKVTAYPEEQLFIAQDSSSGTFMHDYSGSPEGRANLSRSLYSLGTTVPGVGAICGGRWRGAPRASKRWSSTVRLSICTRASSRGIQETF